MDLGIVTIEDECFFNNSETQARCDGHREKRLRMRETHGKLTIKFNRTSVHGLENA